MPKRMVMIMNATMFVCPDESKALAASAHRLICVTPPSRAAEQLQGMWERGLDGNK